MSKKLLIACAVMMTLLFITVRWQAGKIDELKESNQSLTVQLSQQVEINKDYQARITRLNQLDIKYTQELASAKNEINTLRDAVSSGSKRVYVKAECPKAGTDTTESGSNEAAPRLSEATEQDYWRLREMMTENEKQTLYLQDYIRTECLR
ncbi:lysis protein [Proteus sp. HMSC14B05]|uniref:lysis protein n=1 Tax=Proteus sp. HMSC14B05 TaxID=1581097 RepID=UPI0008A292E2|nr:lysis protein [Proteus sp. HMSC14B05]OFV17886.1 lysozyme [Proteus sp. HMSC14B05]